MRVSGYLTTLVVLLPMVLAANGYVHVLYPNGHAGAAGKHPQPLSLDEAEKFLRGSLESHPNSHHHDAASQGRNSLPSEPPEEQDAERQAIENPDDHDRGAARRNKNRQRTAEYYRNNRETVLAKKKAQRDEKAQRDGKGKGKKLAASDPEALDKEGLSRHAIYRARMAEAAKNPGHPEHQQGLNWREGNQRRDDKKVQARREANPTRPRRAKRTKKKKKEADAPEADQSSQHQRR